MKRIALLAAVLLMSCSTHWKKPGATSQDFARDHAECHQQAYIFGVAFSETRYQDCMAARGYTTR